MEAAVTRQTSIAEEHRDTELKTKMETAKEDRERQMQCMQDIRRMSITGAAWKMATPSLSPSSLLSFNRGVRPLTRQCTKEENPEDILFGDSRPADDRDKEDQNNNNDASSVNRNINRLTDASKPRLTTSFRIPRQDATSPMSPTTTSRPTTLPISPPASPSASTTSSAPPSPPAGTTPKSTTLLLSPSAASKGLRATLKKEMTVPAEEEEEREEEPRYPNAPALRRTSRSWTMPRQSGTEFRRNSRVQPVGVADARRRFEEVDKKPTQVSRSQTFSPATTAAGAANSAVQIKAALMTWCQQKTRGYSGVDVKNFSSSWADGLAFAAIVHHYAPDAFDFESLSKDNRRENFELAFRVADERLGAMALLDVDDMIAMGNRPDWKCVFTYVQSLYRHGREFEAKRAKAEE